LETQGEYQLKLRSDKIKGEELMAGKAGERIKSKESGSKQKPIERKSSSGGTTRHEGAPVSGRISSGFGTRKDPKTGKIAGHNGVDISVKVNTPVRATAGGKVIRAGWENPKNHNQGYGQRVTIDNGHGNTSTYGHLNKVDVKQGATITSGQTIGLSGNTGKSTGPHVHYGEQHNGKSHRPTYHPDKYGVRK